MQFEITPFSVKRVPDNPKFYFSWTNQYRQYPEKGEPGLTEYIPPVDWVRCLTYRDENGKLIGVLNYYTKDVYAFGGIKTEEAGNACIFVAPEWQGKGIGIALTMEAIKLFGLNLNKQTYTPSGYKLLLKVVDHINKQHETE